MVGYLAGEILRLLIDKLMFKLDSVRGKVVNRCVIYAFLSTKVLVNRCNQAT